MHRHGIRPRIAVTNGIKAWGQVQRFLCQRCKKSFTLLTEFLLPFKHYVVTEIEGALHHIFQGGELSKAPSGASESTLRRWRDEYKSKIQEWSGSLEDLEDMMLQKYGTPSLIRLMSDPLVRLEEILSRLPPLPFHWPVMIKALWWFAKSHPL
jgi:hypothetical protein